MKKLLLIILTTVFSTTIIAQDLMTIGEVFDFTVGDEFHISGNGNGQPPNADRITITDKYYSTDSSIVSYVRFHDSYYTTILMEPPYLEYHFWTETDTISYTNLDSVITSYVHWVSYDTSMVRYDTINYISEDYCDSIINGYDYEENAFEPVYYINHFGKGLGLVKDYYYNPAEGMHFDNVLFYYSKNGIGCGTPDTLILSAPSLSTNISISIYPNPTSSYFFIEQNSFEYLEMKIYNSTGNLLDTQYIYGNNTYYDCSSFQPGIYFLWFITESERYCRKLIIK